MDVKFTDHSKEVLAKLEKAKERGLEAIGISAERFAKKDSQMPVDTGRARNSITWATKKRENQSYSYTANEDGKKVGYTDTIGAGADKDSVYIGSNVEYFPQIELGGRNINARHVLQRAVQGHSDHYKKLAKDSMENA